MALYNIAFQVSWDTVTPDTPQRAGRYGDKEQTVVTLKPTFDGAGNYQYRLEITDGAGGYDVTELMKPANGVITYTIPAAWTHPGIAILRLVAVKLDENYNETERFHCPPAYLLFENRDNGEQLWSATDTAWQAVMGRALGVSLEAETAALVAKSAATEAGENAAAAEQFCEQAREIAENAQQAAEEARNISGVAKDSAESAATSAAEAAAAAVDAQRAAQSAVQDATAAGAGYAVRAETAAAQAELSEDACQDALEQVENLSGIAEDIRELAGEGDEVWHPCVTVDTALDETSDNPLSNRAVAAALNEKANAADTRRVYKTFGELGLESVGETASLDEIFTAMANNSTFITSIGAGHGGVYPASYLLLEVIKLANFCAVFRCTERYTTARVWVGTYVKNPDSPSGKIDWTGWKQLVDSDAVDTAIAQHEHWASAIPCNAGGYSTVEDALTSLCALVGDLRDRVSSLEDRLVGSGL